MKIALIYPRTFSQMRSFFPPLGIISLATVLKANNYSVKIFDSSFEHSFKKITRELKKYNPDITGISLTTDLYPAAKQLCATAKQLNSFTVMGGPHASLFAEEILTDCQSLDAVAIGEGEQTMLDLIYQLHTKQSLAPVNGLVWRNNYQLVTNSKRKWIDNINTIPYADRSLLPTYKKYAASGFTGVLFTRGCPYQCKFCQPVLDQVAGHFRYRNATNIADELLNLYQKDGNTLFHIDDDLFVINRQLIKDLIEALEKIDLKGKIQFIVLSRVDIFDKELAALLKELGVVYILFGVESGDQTILDYFDKKITVKQIKDAFALAKEFGFTTHAFVILGSPKETKSSLEKTEQLLTEIAPDSIFFSLFVPGLKTHLYEELKNNNHLNIKSYEHLSFYSWKEKELPIKAKGVTYEEIISFKNTILKKRRSRFIIKNTVDAIKQTLKIKSVAHLVYKALFFVKKRQFAG